MEQSAFLDMIERYKEEMLKTAARSKWPVEEGNSPRLLKTISSSIEQMEEREEGPEINPLESGRGQDTLQNLDEEVDTYENFQRENQETGLLKIQAYAGRQIMPVSGAQVTITHTFTDGTKEFASGTTDENGILDNIILPAPSKQLAESPTGEAPYAMYDIVVSHPNYRTEIYRQVPVFEGIKSIQPVRFLSDRSPS